MVVCEGCYDGRLALERKAARAAAEDRLEQINDRLRAELAEAQAKLAAT